MKKYAIVGIGSALLAGLLVIAGVLIGTRGLGGSAATPAAEAVPAASEVAELPIGEPGGTGKIKIPGFDSMTFKAGQRQQAVELKNPEENDCYMVLVIELPDGNDLEAVIDALNAPTEPGKPKCIVAHTVKGKGVSFMEGDFNWHGKAPNEEQRQKALAELEA